MFTKTADSEIISIVKTAQEKDTQIFRCSKCLSFHKESDPCPAEEYENEYPGKNK